MSAAADPTVLVVHPATAEILDLRAAETITLAAAVAGLDDLRADLTDFERVVERELLARLDRGAKWTLRLGDPAGDVQFEVKAPSPDAGTDGYDERLLETELLELVSRRTINEDGAAAALRRTVTVTVEVPLEHDLEALVDKLRDVDAIAGVPVRASSVTTARKAMAAGIKALRKVEGTGRALDRASVRLPARARRARVKTVHRETR
jgi:hypothetical protein